MRSMRSMPTRSRCSTPLHDESAGAVHRERGPLGDGGLHAGAAARRARRRPAAHRHGRHALRRRPAHGHAHARRADPTCPSWRTPTSAVTAAVRCTGSTSCTRTSWWSWRPTTCGSCAASFPTPRPRPARSGACADDLAPPPPALAARVAALEPGRGRGHRRRGRPRSGGARRLTSTPRAPTSSGSCASDLIPLV